MELYEYKREAVEPADRPLRIAFLTFENDYDLHWLRVKEGVVAAQKYLSEFGTTLDYVVMSEHVGPDPIEPAIRNAIQKGYDGIVVVPIFDGMEAAIDDAADKGISVMTFCAEGSIKTKRLLFVGQDAYAAGRLLGAEIGKRVGAGKMGIITGFLNAKLIEARRLGAVDYLKELYPGISVVATEENLDSPEMAYNQASEMMAKHDDLKAIYLTAGGAIGAVRAIEEAGKADRTGMYAYDWGQDNVECVKKGIIKALVDQDPYGQGFDTPVMMHNYLVTGRLPAEDFYPTRMDLLTPENVGERF